MSLRGKVKARLANEMIRSLVNQSQDKKFLLILDDLSSEILSSVWTFSNAINMGLFSIEHITKKRKPYRSFNAIYFITPTEENCQAIVSDYNKKNRLYKTANIFFTFPVADYMLDILVEKDLVNRITTCKEANISFELLDSNVFKIDSLFSSSPVDSLFISNDQTLTKLHNTTDKLITVLISMNEFPNIVYYKNPNCEKLALYLNRQLNTFYREKGKSKRTKGIIVITSRLADLCGPLSIDLTYSTLLFDNYPKEKYTITFNQDKQINIGDSEDTLISKYKSFELSKVLEVLPEDFSAFSKSDAAAAGKSSELKTLDEVDTAVKNISEYKAKNILFSKHLKLAEDLSNKMKEDKIMEVIDLQYTIMSGVDSAGKKASIKDITKEIKRLCKRVNHKYILRLLCMMKYYLDISQKDFDTVVESLNDNETEVNDRDMKLINFFCKETAMSKSESNAMDKDIILYRNKMIEKNKDKRYPVYVESRIGTICDMIACGKPVTKFEWIDKEKTSLFSGKPPGKTLLISQDNANSEEAEKNNLYLFSFGGLSHYEIGDIYRKNRINSEYRIIPGSDVIYNANEYLNFVESYSKGSRREKRNSNLNQGVDPGEIELMVKEG